jgi:hypothetical protein
VTTAATGGAGEASHRFSTTLSVGYGFGVGSTNSTVFLVQMVAGGACLCQSHLPARKVHNRQSLPLLDCSMMRSPDVAP